MKKFFALIILAAGLRSALFSLTESSSAFGPGWSHLFETASENGQTAKTYMSAPGVVLNNYDFWNKGSIGIFTGMAFLFPNKSVLNINGVKTTVDLSIYDILLQYNMILGPGFRLGLDKNLTLRFGIGLNCLQTFGSYITYVYVAGYSSKIGYTMYAFNLGIGGDIGVKYDITDGFFFCVGSTFSYDLACYTTVYSSFGDAAGWAGDYSMIGIRPYLCIGINLWAEEPGFFTNKIGKPE